MRRVSLTTLVGTFIFLAAMCSAQAASRGLSVELRASESKDAPVAGEVKLYGSSHALVIGNDIRLALVAFIVSWSFLLIGPFIAILIWAAILSVALYPVYLWLNRMLGDRSALASFLLTVFALVAILGPVSAIGAALVANLSGIVTEISKGTITLPPAYIAEWPLVGSRLSMIWQAASVGLAETLAPFGPQIKKLLLRSSRLLGILGSVCCNLQRQL